MSSNDEFSSFNESKMKHLLFDPISKLDGNNYVLSLEALLKVIEEHDMGTCLKDWQDVFKEEGWCHVKAYIINSYVHCISMDIVYKPKKKMCDS